MMERYVRVSRNFVNLGNLYTTSIQHSIKRPTGWGYFADGSIFVVPHTPLDHDNLQMRMQIAAHFVSSPTPKMQAIREHELHRARFVVISEDNATSGGRSLRLSARNASDGDYPADPAYSFENVVVTLDRNTHGHIRTEFQGSVAIIKGKRRAIKQALYSFRGTLIDGILQPNVRLGNGLEIKGVPQLQRDHAEVRTTVNANSSTMFIESAKSSAKTAMEPPADTARKALELKEEALLARSSKIDAKEEALLARANELDAKEEALLARTSELDAKEEIMRWKYRAWSLEQKIAKKNALLRATRTVPSRGRNMIHVFEHDQEDLESLRPESNAMPQSQPDTRGDVFASNAQGRPITSHTPHTESQSESTGDPFPGSEPQSTNDRQASSTELSHESENAGDVLPFLEFEPTPPPALESLRSRLQQLGRRTPTMRSRRRTRSS